MVPLLILGSVGIVAALAAVAVYLGRRSRRAVPSPTDGGHLDDAVLVPAGPVDGFANWHGPDYAPQPVFELPVTSSGYQPHRPVLTKSATVRVRPGGGAHRRESDSHEIARLTALHRAGALSDIELAALKARLA